MPIADSTLILEGQQDFSGGMDSSLSPTLIGNNSVATAVNLTFRGGRPSSRPGFRQVGLQSGINGGLDRFSEGYYQGGVFYEERRANFNSCIICVVNGQVIRINLGTLVTDRLSPVLPASSMIPGTVYTIASLGTTTFTSHGAPSNTVGVSFTATSVGTGTGTVYSLNQDFLDPDSDCFLVQAEKYVIIQDGKNTPLIFDGDALYVSGVGLSGTTGALSQVHSIGPGTIMAYGQGRLFVTNTSKTEITAGDLVYGGSTVQIPVVSALGQVTGGLSTHTDVTLGGGATQSGNDILVGTQIYFSVGDYVTLTGVSAATQTAQNINGTWKVQSVSGGATPVITIAAGISNSSSGNPATGGFVTKANAGRESDLLRFSETTYLDEGGALQVPAFMGKITGMVFMPIQDTGTGQGDLLVFCERGTASIAVSAPRSEWKNTEGFQRVVLQDVGSTGHRCIATTNGDIFFRSFDGLRSYRNARAELNDYGQVPISAEMNSVLKFDSKDLLKFTSAIIFDNRLLFTASPTVNYQGLSTYSQRQPVTFSKIVALDFTTLSTIGAKRAASYDGMWGGLNVLELFSGLVGGKPRAYAICYDYVNGRVNIMWELTENAIFDYPQGVGAQRIKSILETRSFSFGSPSEQKRMIRADFWLSDITGQVDVNVYWRPDQYPCWRPWHNFTRCALTDNCINSGVTVTPYADGTTQLCFSSVSPTSFYYRLGKDGTYTEPILFTYSENGQEQADTLKAALIAVGFPITFCARSGNFPNYCFIISIAPLPFWENYTNVVFDLWENMGLWQAPYSPGNFAGEGLDLKLIPTKLTASSSCDSAFIIKNLQPQYRPQIRMPTPPEDSDPIISRPYIYGNEFQLRLEFLGHFELNRILMLGQRILEQYQGTDTLEVL